MKHLKKLIGFLNNKKQKHLVWRAMIIFGLGLTISCNQGDSEDIDAGNNDTTAVTKEVNDPLFTIL